MQLEASSSFLATTGPRMISSQEVQLGDLLEMHTNIYMVVSMRQEPMSSFPSLIVCCATMLKISMEETLSFEIRLYPNEKFQLLARCEP